MHEQDHTTTRLRRAAALTALTVLAGLVAIGVPSPASAGGDEAPRAARALTAGRDHTCALLDNGDVQCWGSNANGQLGLGDTDNRGDAPGEMGDNLPAVDLGTGRTARAITAGGYFTCALLDNATVKCWGSNGDGQLGLGDIDSRGDGPGEMGDNLPIVPLGTGRTARAITAGNDHACALLDNATVKCWGYSSDGQLGLGEAIDRGDDPGEMGDNLPIVLLGTGRTARSISAGAYHTCAVLDNGSVKCWGFNTDGQLGLGDTDNRGDAPGEMGDTLPAVDLGTGRTARTVSGGRDHTCAVLDNGSVKCWGYNSDGQLGLGDPDTRGDDAGEMGDNLPAVDLGTGRTARAITASRYLTCARLDNGSVKCWGYNSDGQLGQGDTSTRGNGPNEMGDNLPPVDLGTSVSTRAITAGAYHVCVVLDSRQVTCWGANSAGELGQGDTGNRGDDANEMGDNLPVVSLAGTVGFGTYAPDALVRVGTKPFVGNDRYNSNARRQIVKATTGRKAVRFTVRIQNDGNEPDRIRVRGITAGTRYTVTYTSGGTNITKKVRKGTYTTPVIAPGARRDITMVVTPKKTAATGNKATTTITLTSRADTTKTDAVKTVVTRR